MSVDDKTYHRLLDSCVDHVVHRLGPRLDEWAEDKRGRWKQSWARDEKTLQREGRAHWQADYHEQFKNVFEREMEVFLRENGCSQADFAAVLTRAYDEQALQAESLGSLVIETMTAIENFEFFANFMDNAVADLEEGESNEEEGKEEQGKEGEGKDAEEGKR